MNDLERIRAQVFVIRINVLVKESRIKQWGVRLARTAKDLL